MDAHLSKDELSGRLSVVSPHLRIILGGRMDHGVKDDPFVAIPEFKDARTEQPLLKLMDLRARRCGREHPGTPAMTKICGIVTIPLLPSGAWRSRPLPGLQQRPEYHIRVR